MIHKHRIRAPFADSNLVVRPAFKKQLLKQLQTGEPFMAQKNLLTLKRPYLALAGAIGVLVIVGGTAAALSARHTNKTLLRETEIPATLSDVLSVDDIQSKALALAGTDVQITKIELENEHGVLVYKVTYSDGTIRLFDARTGELSVNDDDSVEKDETVPVGFAAGVTIQSARQTAQNIFPGKTITKIELETENGVVVYSVRFSDDSRVDVNATDGSVVRTRDGSGSSSSDSSDSSSDDSTSDDSQDDSNGGSNDDSSNESEDESGDDNSGSNSGSGRSGSGRDSSDDN